MSRRYFEIFYSFLREKTAPHYGKHIGPSRVLGVVDVLKEIIILPSLVKHWFFEKAKSKSKWLYLSACANNREITNLLTGRRYKKVTRRSVKLFHDINWSCLRLVICSMLGISVAIHSLYDLGIIEKTTGFMLHIF